MHPLKMSYSYYIHSVAYKVYILLLNILPKLLHIMNWTRLNDKKKAYAYT